MHAWESIQNTLEEIEQRIGEEVTVEELANTANLSLFYYQRLFSRLVGKPVREYIKLRRLARACEALLETDHRILDIALDYGFDSHEVFTRAFKDAYKMTPTEYRESRVGLNNFDKPDLSLKYIMIDIGVPLMSDGLVLEINRQTLAEPITFIGIRGDVPIAEHFPNGKTTGVSHPGVVWDMFHEQKDKFPRIPNGRNLGVAYHDSDVTPAGCFSYFVGTERKTVDSECHTWTLPAAEYLVCRFEAETFDELQSVAMNKAFNYIRMWQDTKGLKHGNFGAEIYYENVEAAGFAYMEIWALWLE